MVIVKIVKIRHICNVHHDKKNDIRKKKHHNVVAHGLSFYLSARSSSFFVHFSPLSRKTFLRITQYYLHFTAYPSVCRFHQASIWSKLASAHFREEKRDLSEWQNLDDAFVIFIDGNHKTISSGTKDSNPAPSQKGTRRHNHQLCRAPLLRTGKKFLDGTCS